jgi:hypothetical protein
LSGSGLPFVASSNFRASNRGFSFAQMQPVVRFFNIAIHGLNLHILMKFVLDKQLIADNYLY